MDEVSSETCLHLGGRRFLFWRGGFLGEQKGESVVTESPKGGIIKNFGRIQGGTTQICLDNVRQGGSRKLLIVMRRDQLKEISLIGRIG